MPQLELQHEVARILAETADPGEALPRALQAIGESLEWPLGSLWRAEPDGEVLRLAETWHEAEPSLDEFEEVSRRMAFPAGLGLPGRVWASGTPQWIADVGEEGNFPRAPAAAAAGLRSAIAFPVRARSGVLGAVEFFARGSAEPEAPVVESLSTLGRQLGQHLEHASFRDAVLHSEALRSAVLESALDCVIVMDHRGQVVDFNPAAERTFGYARSDVIGQEMAEMIIPPSLRERHRRGLARYLATGEGPVVGTRFEITGMRADGSEFPVELAIAPITVGSHPLFTGYVRDITERKRAEEERATLLELERTAKQRAQRAERRAAFLADVGAALGSSLDYAATLDLVARSAVPELADWCVVDMLAPSGSIERVAVAHVDPEKRELPFELARRYPPSPDDPEGAAKIIRTGRSELLRHFPDELLVALAHDDEHLRILRDVGLASAIGVPLTARGRTLGAMALISSDPARIYDEDDLAMAEEVARRAAVAVDNARLYQERSDIARTLQRSLLPPALPQIEGLSIAARYRPAGEGNDVGGDFYDLFQTAGGAWAIVMGDVSGKGAAAAAVTALARYTLRAAASRESRPSRILALLNEALLAQRGPEELCTVAFGSLTPSPRGMRLTLANAGHPPPLLARAGGAVETAGGYGTALGVTPDLQVSDRVVELGSGDAIVFYTDGVLDAHAPDLPIGERELADVLRACGELEPARCAEHLERSVVERAEGEPRDDMAILVVRVDGAPSRAAAAP